MRVGYRLSKNKFGYKCGTNEKELCVGETMGKIKVSAHQRVVNEKAIWVPIYFRDGVEISESEAAKYIDVSRYHGKSLAEIERMDFESSDVVKYSFSEESRQQMLLERQDQINTNWIRGDDRRMLENAMEEFRQAEDADTQYSKLDELDEVITQVNQNAEIRQGHAQAAQRLLGDMPYPKTDEGKRLRHRLENVVIGAEPFTPDMHAQFQEVVLGERNQTNVQQTLLDASPAFWNGLNSFEELQRFTYALRDYPEEEMFPRVKYALEETQTCIRNFTNYVQQDLATSREFEQYVEPVMQQINALDYTMQEAESRLHSMGTVGSAYEDIEYRVRSLGESMEELSMRLRSRMNS
jgi:hypothetical protein